MLCVLLTTAWFFRAPLLRNIAQAYIVADEPISADAIVVLGGGLETRPFAAAQLFHQSWAKRILVMDVQASPTCELGVTPTEAEQTRQVLDRQGVAATNVVTVGQAVASTYDEAVATRLWTATNAVRVLLIPTDLFHTRRVRWLFQRQFAGTDVIIKVIAVPPRHYTATNWWQHESGLIAFQNEIIKSVYYRWKY